MSIEIKAPSFPESVADGTIATWHKQPGEICRRDELIVDIETDKVVLEVVAPAHGRLQTVLMTAGETVLSQQVIATFSANSDAVTAVVVAAEQPATTTQPAADKTELAGPAVRKLLEEHHLDAGSISGTGKGGRITKDDILSHLKQVQAESSEALTPVPKTPIASQEPVTGDRVERRVPMTRLRHTIAKRLVAAQNDAAMLTTYNEVNMQPVMDLRRQYKELFEQIHNGTKLGFMSFFVKAATEALKRFPAVNASLDGHDMVYHGYQDIGIAVSTERGLVVPILRDTDGMSLADIEKGIAELALRGREGKLSLDDMRGGTFTITNGGIFGSLLSTPILNPPQTAILGMHKIQERPIAEQGQVVIRPMMYLALSYDHRMIDGKEAVQFLLTIKDLLEDPARMLLEI